MLQTTIRNAVHHALPHGLEVLGDVSVKEIFPNDKFERIKDKPDSFREEVSVYEMDNNTLGNTLLEREITMKAMKRSQVNSRRIMSRFEQERSFFMKKNEVHISCSSQTPTTSGTVTDNLLKKMRPLHLEIAYNVQKAVQRCCSREFFSLIYIISEMRRIW